MNKKLINILGLTGVISLLSYTAAVVFSPLAYHGYDWLSQAVSDLSASDAPSRILWQQLAAFYNVCSVVCVTCAAVYVSGNKTGTKLFRLGIYLFTVMNWISHVGYTMFPLDNSGKKIESFQEIMHIVITVPVVLLSIVSLTMLIISGFKKSGIRSLGVWAAAALAMMFIGSVGSAVLPQAYFGLMERFNLFSAVGFNAVLGVYLFTEFGKAHIQAD